MFDQDKDQKTEDATPKQRQKFREEGQLAKSQDVNAIVALSAATAAIVCGWPLISSNLAGCARNLLGRLDAHGREDMIIAIAGKSIIGSVAPIAFTVLILSIAGQLAQVGFNFSLKPMVPNLSKLNPLPKLGEIFFSASAALELAKSLVKVCVISVIAVRVLIEEFDKHGRLAGLSVSQLLSRMGEIALRIVIEVGVALAFIAVLDLVIERYRHKVKMRMSKQEVKQEGKDSEGDPTMKGRVRGKQREMGRQRMMEDVATADAVVVNPSHYSVALKYNITQDPAPRIVALGMDDLAFKIRERARHEGIPVVSNPPLARGLFAKGKLGAYIPAEYYQAAASLLAWVYSLTGRVS
ncbi:MAG: EscU/YscU/HrcU family type III secretion system export apparatus switch protein [Proteobacteria bacterium]|nr:EscU/YscU/HrcU family type III secretion system export apparatus switch protein [Pseudomonadota bacterium]